MRRMRFGRFTSDWAYFRKHTGIGARIELALWTVMGGLLGLIIFLVFLALAQLFGLLNGSPLTLGVMVMGFLCLVTWGMWLGVKYEIQKVLPHSHQLSYAWNAMGEMAAPLTILGTFVGWILGWLAGLVFTFSFSGAHAGSQIGETVGALTGLAMGVLGFWGSGGFKKKYDPRKFAHSSWHFSSGGFSGGGSGGFSGGASGGGGASGRW